jgi:hypothetical protein
MLRIRQHQWESLSLAAEDDFVSRAAQHLSALFSEGGGAVDNRLLRDEIVKGLRLARSLGVVNEVGVIRFLEARCLSGPDFPYGPEHEWALRLLQCDSTDMDRTMEYIGDTARQKSKQRG